MARTGADSVYVWNWTDKDSNQYSLHCIASDNTSTIDVTTAPDVIMNSKSLDFCNYKRGFDGLPIGMEKTPVLELELDISYVSDVFKAFLTDPFRNYTTNWTANNYIQFTGGDLDGFRYNFTNAMYIGNQWYLYCNSSLVFWGFQKTGITGNYDNNKVSIEIYHGSRVVMENINLGNAVNMKVLAKTTAASGNLKESQCAVDMFFRKSDYAYTKDNFLFGHVAPRDKYYYYIKLNYLFEFINKVYEGMAYLFTRQYNIQSNYASQLPLFDNTTYYKQNYEFDLGRGTVLTTADIYILGFVADLSLSVDRTSVNILYGFYENLEQYKNVWDFYVAYAKQSLVRCNATAFGLDYEKATEGYYCKLDNKEREKSKLEIDLESEILDKTECASVEKIESDIDKIEFILNGSRSQNDDNLVLIFNTQPAVRKIEWTNAYGTNGDASYMNSFLLTTVDDNLVAYSFAPNFLKLYYFERPFVESVYLTTDVIPIGVNHNIDIDLGNTINSDDFITEITATIDMTGTPNLMVDFIKAALIVLQRACGGSMYHYSRCYSELFNGRIFSQMELSCDFNLPTEIYLNTVLTATTGNAIISFYKPSIFEYDILAKENVPANPNDKFMLLELEMDLTANKKNKYKTITNIKMLSTNYA